MILMKNSYEIIHTGISSFSYDYHITFRLNDKCNLACEYCRWFDGENYSKSIETVLALFEFFKTQRFKNVLFYFHGGEPAIHPEVIKVLDCIKENSVKNNINVFIEFQTNLSYSTNKLKKIIKSVDKISISYHYNELMRTKTHLQFVKNFIYLKLNNVYIDKFDIMLENVSENELDIFYKNILWFLKYDKIIDSEMIHGFCHYDKNPITKSKHIQFYNKYNKTEQIYKIDDKLYNTNELFSEGLNCKGCKCDAGSKYVVINSDGNVFKCGIEMTYYRMKCVDVKPITNVLLDKNYLKMLNIKLKTKTICNYDYCGGDFYIQKYKGNK